MRTLRGGKIGGLVAMTGSNFLKTVVADEMTVGLNLKMDDFAHFEGEVHLIGARVEGQIAMDNSIFDQDIEADGRTVKHGLLLRSCAKFKGDVVLSGVTIDGPVEMQDAEFDKAVKAENLKAGQDVFARSSHFAGKFDLGSAHIYGDLDLRGSVARHIDLSSAVVEKDLRIGGNEQRESDASQVELTSTPVERDCLKGHSWWPPLRWQCSAGDCGDGSPSNQSWPLADPIGRNTSRGASNKLPLPMLILRNTHVGALQDSADAWPPSLDLEGFRYDHLGGWGGEGADDMRVRTPEEWRDWLERDPTFSTQPYTQLAAVLLASGHRDTAETIQYFGRERERAEASKNDDWGQWAWLTFLSGVAGYGIGLYTFRAAYWVVGLTALGTVALQFSPNARARGALWCVGASLHRLLPIVELNKEFKDFFENPRTKSIYEPRNLKPWQMVLFSVLALLGWILGLFLLAAMGGLTQKG